MKSPFPGMDPYLESRWRDLHPRLIVKSAAQLQRQFGNDMVANIEERVVVEDTGGYSRPIGPDIRVIETRPRPWTDEPASGGVATEAAVAAPMVLTLRAEPMTERFIEMIDVTAGGRVITVIEFLSPSNKLAGDGLRQYRQKQQECYDAKVNLVEIDLTRAGHRTLLCHQWSTARKYDDTFGISIWRAAWGSQVELYPLPLRKPLPAVRIPLRPTDHDVVLSLQPILDECYAEARYDRTVDYSSPLDPPLSEADAGWAAELLKGR